MSIRATGAREQQRARPDSHMIGKVTLELGQQVRRDCNLAHPGRRLRGTDDRLLPGYSTDRAAYPDYAMFKIDVFTT